MINLKKVLKIIGIVIFAPLFLILLMGYMLERNAELIGPMLFFGVPLLLLCKSLKSTPKVNDWVKIETPEEQKNDLKRCVSKDQIQNAIRIMNDCISIMKTTKNLDTFFERWRVGQRNNLFLKQCEDCKVYRGKPTSEDYSKFFFSNEDVLLKMIITKTYLDTIEKANNLKTDAGKSKRIQNYFENLDEYSDSFSPDIEEYVEQLKNK